MNATNERTTMNPNTFSVSVLLHKDGKAWVAQCLEHDVAAQGKTAEEAKRRFLHTLTAQILMDLSDGKDPLVHLGPAPERYFDLSVKTKQAGPELPVYVPVNKSIPRVSAMARFLEAA